MHEHASMQNVAFYSALLLGSLAFTAIASFRLVWYPQILWGWPYKTRVLCPMPQVLQSCCQRTAALLAQQGSPGRKGQRARQGCWVAIFWRPR